MSVAAPEFHEPAGVRHAFGELLRGGVLLSAILLLGGLVLAAVHGTTGLPAGAASGRVEDWLPALRSGSAWPLRWLGVAVLAATPLARVLLALAEFARARDAEFVALTGFVLAVLLGTAALGVVVG